MIYPSLLIKIRSGRPRTGSMISERGRLTEFPARIPFESFSGLSPTSVDPNAFGVGRNPAWGRRRGEVQRVERPAAGKCQRGDKQPANGQQGGPRPEAFSRRPPDDAAYGHA